MSISVVMKCPYPWFGGKKMVAEAVWQRFGDVRNYVEPFFGGGAMLLNRPEAHTGHTETVNDINAWLTNFWRAAKADPDAVAHYAGDPVNELDLHSRGDWLFYRRDYADFVEAMRSDPEYYDAKSAGWWVWGQCAWIGTGWGRVKARDTGTVNRSLPHLSNAGRGVNRKRPHLSNAGTGVNRQLPHLGAGTGDGITDTSRKAAITQYMRELSVRFSAVRICCGDWKRVCASDATTVNHGLTGVFLDPPYAVDDRANCYGDNDTFDLAHEVRDWAIQNGDRMRIALCGYDEHDASMPATWECYRWKAAGGYASQGSRSAENRKRETIYFSPMCIRPEAQADLFDNNKESLDRLEGEA